MSDLIDRQAAISAICNSCGKIDCDKMDKCEKLQLPPANNSEIPNSSDTISRQAAIDAAFEEQHYTSMTTNPTPDVTEQDKHNSLVIVRALQMAKTIIEAED